MYMYMSYTHTCTCTFTCTYTYTYTVYIYIYIYIYICMTPVYIHTNYITTSIHPSIHPCMHTIAWWLLGFGFDAPCRLVEGVPAARQEIQKRLHAESGASHLLGPKMIPKWSQNGPQMVPKWSPHGPKMVPGVVWGGGPYMVASGGWGSELGFLEGLQAPVRLI